MSPSTDLQQMNVQSNIKSGGGYVHPYIWSFGSRRAVSERLYLGLQIGVYFQEYMDVFYSARLDPSGQEYATFGQTLLYGALGMTATAITGIGAFATGQWVYAGLAFAAIPLQMMSLYENLHQQIERSQLRKGYEKRLEIISEGFH